MAVPVRDPGPQNLTLDTFMETLLANMTASLLHAADPEGVPNPFEYQEPTTYGNPIQLGPRLPDPATQAARAVEGARNAAQKWHDNTLAPKRSPKAAALAAAPKWANAVTQAVQRGAYAAGVSGINEDLMVETIRAVGPAGYSAGVAARQGKIQAAFAKLAPLMAAHVATIDRMPTDTDAAREAKVVANLRGMKAVGLAYKGVAAGGGR
jgi:hypothetical protein